MLWILRRISQYQGGETLATTGQPATANSMAVTLRFASVYDR